MNRGRVCADSSNPNNKLDNCFYSNSFWDGPSESGYLAGTGKSNVHPGGSYYYSSTSKTHKAHLEGIESADFDLYLYKWNSSTSTWNVVSRSERFSSIEDITYSGGAGYYAWVVASYSGSGGYTLYRSPN
jgi:streptogrisin C